MLLISWCSTSNELNWKNFNENYLNYSQLMFKMVSSYQKYIIARNLLK